MGVDCDGCMVYGWQLEYEDIPDLEAHYDNGWRDVFETIGGYVVRENAATNLRADDVVLGDNAYESYDGQTWYVGIPLDDDKTAQEFVAQLDQGLAEFIYLKVTGEKPNDLPKVMCFGRWW